MLISAGDIISKSISLYRDNLFLFFRYALLLFIPPSVVIIATTLYLMAPSMQSIRDGSTDTTGIWLFILVAFFVIIFSVWVTGAMVRAMAKIAKKKSAGTLTDQLFETISLIPDLIVVAILTAIASIFGFLLFILPGILVSVWLAFAFFIVAIKKTSALDAIAKSKELVDRDWYGIFWRLLAPAAVFTFLSLLFQGMVSIPITGHGTNLIIESLFGLLGMFVGSIFVPFMVGAIVILYVELDKPKLRLRIQKLKRRKK